MRSLVGVVLVLAGCGYSSGYRLPEGVYRLAVPVFENQTFPLRRELEFDMTRALKQRLELKTDARIVSREEADAVLEGTILTFTDGVLTEGRLDLVQESVVVMRVRVRLVRTVDGSVILDRIITDTEAFSTRRGETVEDARREAIEKISERITAELEPWS